MGNRAGEQIGLPWGILRSWRPQDDGSKWIAAIAMTGLLRSCLAAGCAMTERTKGLLRSPVPGSLAMTGLPWGILRSQRPQDDNSKWIAPIVMTRWLRCAPA
ncbi:MAG: hypothetical protein JNK18_07725 [Cyclobacteriaceae bacterium]|nr:hypothetical protein [Cyclobacteriaceae bacterium]